MGDLRDHLRTALDGAGLVGVGNPDLGDDGAGPALAEALAAAGAPGAIVAGTDPERWMEDLSSGRYRNVVFLDAVEFPGEPGSAVFLDASAVQARFPQVSTHRISLGTLARLIEARSGARCWLLGVKPETLRPGRGLSGRVRRTVGVLADLMLEILREQPRGRTMDERPCIA